jgi:hypothetical protein
VDVFGHVSRIFADAFFWLLLGHCLVDVLGQFQDRTIADQWLGIVIVVPFSAGAVTVGAQLPVNLFASWKIFCPSEIDADDAAGHTE